MGTKIGALDSKKPLRRPMRKAKWLRNHTFTQKLLAVCGIEAKTYADGRSNWEIFPEDGSEEEEDEDEWEDD